MINDIIILEYRNERGQAAEIAAEEIVDTRTFPVDAVSGAANSGKIIQMAVQNALEGGYIYE